MWILSACNHITSPHINEQRVKTTEKARHNERKLLLRHIFAGHDGDVSEIIWTTKNPHLYRQLLGCTKMRFCPGPHWVAYSTIQAPSWIQAHTSEEMWEKGREKKIRNATSFISKIELRRREMLPILSLLLFALYLDDIWNNGNLISSSYVVLYADNILLIYLLIYLFNVQRQVSSSVCELQRTFDACERELVWLDMAIYTKNPSVSELALEMIMSVLT